MERATARRVRARSVALVVALTAVAGCELDPTTGEDPPNAILGGGIEDELDAMALLDPMVYVKIGNCVDSAKLKTLSGDPAWHQIWIDGGENAAALRGECERLAINDPRALDAIHAEWVAFEQATGATAG